MPSQHQRNSFAFLLTLALFAGFGFYAYADGVGAIRREAAKSASAGGASVDTDWAVDTGLTHNWGANATVTAYSRRDHNDELWKVDITFTGAPSAATLTISFDNGTTDETALSPGGITNTATLGRGMTYDGSTDWRAVECRYRTSSDDFVVLFDDGVDSWGTVTQAAPYTYGSGDLISLDLRRPRSDW